VFSVLELIEPHRGECLSAKMRRILKRPKVDPVPFEIKGAGFTIIRAELLSDGQPDWEEIAWVAKEYSRWIILPQNLSPDFAVGSGIKVFSTAQFDKEVLLKTVCRMLHFSQIPMYRRVVALLDDSGEHADMLFSLLHYCTSVKVVTRDLGLYEQSANKMMEKLGAPVFVSDVMSGLYDCVLALSPGNFSSGEDVSIPFPIAITEKSTLKLHRNCNMFTGLKAALPEGCSPPGEIDPHSLAGALYTLSGAGFIDPIAHNMLYSNRYVNIAQASQIISKAL